LQVKATAVRIPTRFFDGLNKPRTEQIKLSRHAALSPPTDQPTNRSRI
jgi:hypothetical protein